MIQNIISEQYPDFGPTFAAEKLAEIHHLKVSDEKLRHLMIEWGLWAERSRKRNKEHREWRERKESFGEMIQFDGSYHRWFENRAPECCLLGSIDDATGTLPQLRFASGEGVKDVFKFWKDYAEMNGKPVAIYLDRGSTYKQNQKKNVLDNPLSLTQFERAMEELSINIIHAHSPQAKGRVERLFGTLQNRLVKELRLRNISDITSANKFLSEIFVPEFNAKFGVKSKKRGNLHRPLSSRDKENIEKVFSTRETRRVLNDFTVRFHNQWFQLGEIQPIGVCRKDKVTVETRLDDNVFVSLRDKYLNYAVLPERPKHEVRVLILTRTKSTWKPPMDHPWRNQMIFANNKKVAEIITSNPQV